MSTTPETANATVAKPVTPVTVEVMVRIRALAMPEPDGRYSVTVPALPGCFTLGDSIEDVQSNIVEAAELWLEAEYDHRRDDALKAISE